MKALRAQNVDIFFTHNRPWYITKACWFPFVRWQIKIFTTTILPLCHHIEEILCTSQCFSSHQHDSQPTKTFWCHYHAKNCILHASLCLFFRSGLCAICFIITLTLPVMLLQLGSPDINNVLHHGFELVAQVETKGISLFICTQKEGRKNKNKNKIAILAPRELTISSVFLPVIHITYIFQ